MKKTAFLIVLTFFLSSSLFAQKPGWYLVKAKIINGDTVPEFELSGVNILGRNFGSKRDARRFDRLVRNVKKVYPYAKIAGIKYKEYEDMVAATKYDFEKKILMKRAEDELKSRFSEEIKGLTFTQGAILLKLIDRQTGNTTFDIIKELRGRLLAYFWQGVAAVFDYNLDEPYDPYGEDKDIETVVGLIETGAI